MKPKVGDIVIITRGDHYAEAISTGDKLKITSSDKEGTHGQPYHTLTPIETMYSYKTLEQILIIGSYKISIHNRMKMLIEKHKR